MENTAFVRSEVNLFQEPPYDLTLQSTSNSEHFPITTISESSSPLDFFIQSNDIQYIDLSNTKLYIKARISNGDGTAISTAVAPVNNFLHSMFQQMTVSLNEVPITPASNHYGYRAYIETLLAYSKDYKQSQGQTALYFKDKDPSSTSITTSDGFKSRYEFARLSNTFEMIGRPFSDIFIQNRYLVPGIDVRISFIRATPQFCIHSAAPSPGDTLSFKYDILEAKLLVKKHTLLPNVMTEHYRLLNAGSHVCYPMKRVEVKAYSLGTGISSNVNENILSGLLPDRIVIGMVDSDAYNGSFKTNPYEFKDFGLSVINVNINGDASANLPINVNFDDKEYLMLYNKLFEGLGIENEDAGIDLEREEYKKHPLMIFNLRDQKEGFSIPKYGNIRIDLKFKKALTQGVTVIIYAEYQSVLQIDKNKNVFYKDYSLTSI